MHTLTGPDNGIRFVLVNGVKVAKIAPYSADPSRIVICSVMPDGTDVGMRSVIIDTPEAIDEWMARDLCAEQEPPK